jgi:hypothetical protein
MRCRILIAAVLHILPAAAFAADGDEHIHDAHTMEAHGAHTGAAAHIHHQHPKGDWMFEYRFMRMSMDGLLDGTDGVDTRDISGVFPGMPPTQDPSKAYRIAPTEMTMDMHMVMVMYGWTDRVALMGMATYLDNEMDMVMHMPAMDMTGTMETDGFGDSLVGVMIQSSDRLTASLGLSIPTGSIDERLDFTMTGTNPMTGMTQSITNRVKAGYPMQLGSGTWDLIPSVTYAMAGEKLGAGVQASYTWRVGENDNDYTLGNLIEVITWAKHAVNQFLLGTIKFSYAHWGRMDGQDPEINPSIAPTTDPRATGGSRVDVSLGLNGFVGNGHSFGIEFGAPIYQDLNGPQMETDWILSLSYQFMM